MSEEQLSHGHTQGIEPEQPRGEPPRRPSAERRLILSRLKSSAMVFVVAVIISFGLGWISSRLLSPAASQSGPQSGGSARKSAEQAQWWTCAMHPQIRQRSPGKCPICFMDLVPVSSGEEETLGPRQIKMTREAVALAEIETAPVRRLFPTRQIRLWGRVEFDETRLATISARFPGRLDRLYVDYTGVPVRAGDHLVEIYSPELVVAQQELLQALLSLKSAPRGSPQFEMASSLLKSSEEKLRLWGILPRQIEEIKQRGVATDHVTLYAPLGGIVITKHAKEGDYVKTGDPIYTIADLSQVWVLFDAYEQDIPWLRYGQTVTFETDAFPGERFTGRIAFIQPTIAESTRTIRVRVNVDNPGQRLKPGMLARGLVEAHLAANDAVFEPALVGKWICPMHPEVVADSPGACRRCGMDLVPVEEVGYVAKSETLTPPLVIPATAPLITGKRALVYVRVPGTTEPVFESREIDLGPRVSEGYVVHSGLEEGEEVVVKGNFKVDSAVQLAGKFSMMYTPEEVPSAAAGSALSKGKTTPVSAAFHAALAPVFSQYLVVQEALARDDATRAQEGFQAILASLRSPPQERLADEEDRVWERLSKQLLQAIENLDGKEKIEAQRRAFHQLSQVLIEVIRIYGYPGETPLVLVHCPMAFEGRGADWLQKPGEIANPYFGESMLRCGEVKEQIQPLKPLGLQNQAVENGLPPRGPVGPGVHRH